MTEPVAALDSEAITDEFSDDYELPTNRLSSSTLQAGQVNLDDLSTTDWLASLSSPAPSTEVLDDDEPPAPQPRPSGMGQHAAPPRMAPTVGAKLSTGLRKGTLLILASALALGVLAGAGYLLASTPWVSSLFSPQPPATALIRPAQPSAQSPTGSDEEIQSPTDSQGPLTQGGPGQASAKDLRDRGVEQYRVGNFDQAITLLESSVNQADDPITYYQLGLAYMAVHGRDHSLDDAELAFRTAISLQPDWAAPEQGLAESLIRRGFYKDAIDPALKATQLDPAMEEAWITLGRAYQGNGQEAEATKAFAQASKLASPPPVQP